MDVMVSSSVVGTDALNRSIACRRCLLCGELQSDATAEAIINNYSICSLFYYS